MCLVLVKKEDGLATVTLNRPDVMNAMSLALREELAAVFEELQQDPEVGVAVVTGAGQAFCAGIDLKDAAVTGLRPPGDGRPGISLLMARRMAEFDRPIIAAVNGVAATGGFELALACDIRIASTEARFADTHARLGVLPGWGLSQKLSRLVGLGRAMEISLTGNYISARQAEAWGLVNRVVAADELMPTCRAVARDILSCVPEAVREYKRLIRDGHDATLAEGMRMESEAFARSIGGITPETLDTRRDAVISRGRRQKKN